jgi:hypothetical protein
MTISISDLYKFAKLSTAGYVDLSGASNFSSETMQTLASGQGQVPRMPAVLGNQFFVGDGWQVLNDPRFKPEIHTDTTSGFAATLFQKGGEKILSVRGTDPGTDGQFNQDILEADLKEIGIFGTAISQTVSLVNLVLRMQAEKGSPNVYQFSLSDSLSLPPAVLNYVSYQERTDVAPGAIGVPQTRYYWLEASMNGVGVGGINAGDKITVVGHSLGGHLAAMATRLFPQLFDQAVVFNSARYDPPTSSALTAKFLNLFSPWGIAPAAGFSNVQMFDSEDQAPGDDSSFVSSLLTGKTFGLLTKIVTEANSHVIEPFMDSLALYNLLASMSPNFTRDDIGRVIESISAIPRDTDETLLKRLYRTLKGPGAQIELDIFVADFINAGAIAAREKYYAKVIELQNFIIDNPGLRVASLIEKSAESLKNLSIDGDVDSEAYRYSLKGLNPFAVFGPGTFYRQHNENGELDLYDQIKGVGLTEYWLEARAKFLSKLIQYNTADGNLSPNAIGAYFEDQSLGVKIGSPDGKFPRYIFAKDAGSDPVVGLTSNDFLFGGKSADSISGGDGKDYIEGAAGIDTIDGGDGVDAIYGGKDDDKLKGGKGDDLLFGDSPDPEKSTEGIGDDEIAGEAARTPYTVAAAKTHFMAMRWT